MAGRLPLGLAVGWRLGGWQWAGDPHPRQLERVAVGCKELWGLGRGRLLGKGWGDTLRTSNLARVLLSAWKKVGLESVHC